MPAELTVFDNTNDVTLPYGEQRIYVFPQSDEKIGSIQVRFRNIGDVVMALGDSSVESPLTLVGSTTGVLLTGGASVSRTLQFNLEEEGSFLSQLSLLHSAPVPDDPYIFTFNLVVIGIDESLVNREAYEQVSQLYAQTRNNVGSAVEQFFSAVYEIVGLNELIPEADLLSPFYNSYQIVADTYRNPTGMLSAVKTLNRHVLLRGGYANLDAYLFDQGILVPRSWQTLSQAAGFSISDDFVDE